MDRRVAVGRKVFAEKKRTPLHRTRGRSRRCVRERVNEEKKKKNRTEKQPRSEAKKRDEKQRRKCDGEDRACGGDIAEEKRKTKR